MKLFVKNGKGDKVHIHIGDSYFMTVDYAYLADLGIYDGMSVDGVDLDELKDKICKRRAYNKAVDLLSRRDHSKKELTDKLVAKGHGEYACYAAEKLERYGYLDDRRFASLFANELIRLKSYGKRRVEQELYRKGIDREIISDVLSECDFPTENLTVLIERKYLKYLSDEKGINKTVNALLRLGYSYSQIKDAIKELINREEFETTDE